MKKASGAALAYSMALSLVTCGGNSKSTETPTTVAAGDIMTATVTDTTTADTAATPEASAEVVNKDKPLVWFNHQPSSSTTGQLDMAALDSNKGTYYVGFDINQGAELQGAMVRGYIEKNIDSIDCNGDGIIGYVLTTSGIGRNDSITRTRGIRKALGIAAEKDGSISNGPVGANAGGTATVMQDGSVEVGRKTYVVCELAPQEMKDSAGATWGVATAGNAIGTWSPSLGNQINVVASDNDGMGTSMFNTWPKDGKVPTSGYDVSSGAVAAVVGGYSGTISQYVDVRTYLTLHVLHNALDGVDIDTGIGTADDTGNVLSSDVHVYKAGERSYYALNIAATAENYADFTDPTMVCVPVSNQLDEASRATKNVQLNIYDSADSFLGSTYQPLFQKYDKFPNLGADYIGDDGQTEPSITNRLGSLSQYDASVINMIKTDNVASYTSLPER